VYSWFQLKTFLTNSHAQLQSYFKVFSSSLPRQNLD
jgi:hypothetical protein